MDFLPEYAHLPWKGRYRPMFKLFANEAWRYVRKGGKPVECETAAQAIEAAKECVKAILNPTIRAEKVEAEAAIPDFLDPEAWSRERAERQAAEQEEAFGTIFVKSRPVKVQRSRRRVRA